jgi:hypothetical protein
MFVRNMIVILLSTTCRGEVAFCSQECREKQIEYDERMEQTCSLTSIKEVPSVPGASSSDQSGNGGETVAAA